MIYYKIAGIEVKLPISWNEVTVKQFKLLMESDKALSGDFYDAVSILSGIDYELIRSWNLSDDSIEAILLNLSFLFEVPEFKELPCPDYYILNGRKLKVTKDITEKQLGQKILFQQAIKEASDKGNIMFAITEALSIYFYTEYSGKEFNPDDLSEIKEAINESSIVEAYPVAAFFLNSYERFWKRNQSFLSIVRNPKK